jgi:hypothetical protein
VAALPVMSDRELIVEATRVLQLYLCLGGADQGWWRLVSSETLTCAVRPSLYRSLSSTRWGTSV